MSRLKDHRAIIGMISEALNPHGWLENDAAERHASDGVSSRREARDLRRVRRRRREKRMSKRKEERA